MQKCVVITFLHLGDFSMKMRPSEGLFFIGKTYACVGGENRNQGARSHFAIFFS